ncbi:MAG: hypothetical protein LBV74_17125 [Tannerella sp.]|jgi:hypothetical protein|nr:hypothetical protein [Tannerella sp.]
MALKLAEYNRGELEKVLQYYSANPSDSLKLKAAEFLIINMPWHFGYGGEYIENYIRKIDSTFHDLPIEKRLVLYTLPGKYPELRSKLEIKPDIKTITADYLIHNIEKSFEVWESSFWLRELGFDDFCEYLLPYRIGREPLSYWKDSLSNDMKSKTKEWTEHISDITKDSYALYEFLKTHLIDDYSKYFLYKVDIPDSVIKQYEFDCIAASVAYCYKLRMFGIPAAVDELPSWGNGDDHHAEVAIIDKRNTSGFVSIDARNLYAAKVYRNTFSVNHTQILQKTNDYIPQVAKNPFYKDVTANYVQTTTITIKTDSLKDDPKHLYLGVFGQGWTPIAHTEVYGKAEFKDIGAGVVYVPFYYKNNRQQFFSDPFYVGSDNSIRYFTPDFSNLRTVSLNRKDRLIIYKVWWSLFYPNCFIEASNNVSFTNPDRIHDINENTYWNKVAVPVDTLLSARYYRIFTDGSSVELAEFHFFDKDGQELNGKIIGDAVTMGNGNINNINDNDRLTFSSITNWVGFDFGKDVSVGKIEYLPRNDANGIYPGMKYELLYFDKTKWASMGIKTTTEYKIVYDNVPKNALLWLRNLTEGHEERIFVYENGKQIWW